MGYFGANLTSLGKEKIVRLGKFLGILGRKEKMKPTGNIGNFEDREQNDQSAQQASPLDTEIPLMGSSAQSKEANDKTDGTTARPSQSFMDRMKEAGEKSSKKIGYVVDGTLIINIVMIAIGSVYLGKCPAQKYIPIYLIVGGVFGILNNILEFVERYRYRDSDEEGPRYHLKAISLFMFAWFIAGCVWVYKAYEPNYEDVEAENYCHKTLYLFSFWLLNIAFILIGLSILLVCCLCIWCVICISS